MDDRLRQVKYKYYTMLGGFNTMLRRDLCQLPLVRMAGIYQRCRKLRRSVLSTHVPWRQFKFYHLRQVIRQSDTTFTALLTKISNGECLGNNDYQVVKSRFVSVEEAKLLCPEGIQLFHSIADVNVCNEEVLREMEGVLVY